MKNKFNHVVIFATLFFAITATSLIPKSQKEQLPKKILTTYLSLNTRTDILITTQDAKRQYSSYSIHWRFMEESFNVSENEAQDDILQFKVSKNYRDTYINKKLQNHKYDFLQKGFKNSKRSKHQIFSKLFLISRLIKNDFEGHVLMKDNLPSYINNYETRKHSSLIPPPLITIKSLTI